MAEKFFTFDEVLGELQVDEDELKRLVSQGELRGFRDGASMKFRREDVERLKKGRETEPTIILTDSDAEISLPSNHELVVDEGARERETVLNMDVFDTEELPALRQPEEEKTEAVPAPVPPKRGAQVDEGAATIIEAAVPPALQEPAGPHAESFAAVKEYEAVSPTRAATGRISRSARIRALQMKTKKSHLLWTVFLFVSTIFVIWPGVFTFNTLRNVKPQYAWDMAERFRGIADWFLSMFS